MHIAIFFALLCTVASSYAYGNHENYGNPYHEGYDDFSSESRSNEKKLDKCEEPDKFDVPEPLIGHKPEHITVEIHGKAYIVLSCPNGNKRYALVTEGDRTFYINDTQVTNVELLAEGANIDFVGRCKGKKITVKAANGKEVKVSKVTCVELEKAIEEL